LAITRLVVSVEMIFPAGNDLFATQGGECCAAATAAVRTPDAMVDLGGAGICQVHCAAVLASLCVVRLASMTLCRSGGPSTQLLRL